MSHIASAAGLLVVTFSPTSSFDLRGFQQV
jgi:hypothetical protein